MNYRQFLFEAAIDAWLKKNTELSQEEKLEAQIIFKDLQSKYVEHLDPKAKNLVVLSFQTLKLLYLSIQKAIIKNLLPATIQWLTREIVSGKVSSLTNIEEDYIPPLRTYQDNSEILPLLKDVPNISELNKILNTLEPEQRELVAQSDLGKIAEMDGWSLYMPHTTEASCELGKTGGKRDTSWCTTVTKGRNLYLHYTGRFDENYTLFYVIKRGVNAEKQPFAKMSVGTVGDEILFDRGDYNVTVNADNKNLTEEKFREVLGDETADFFLDKIREVIGQSEFKHPMKIEMERLATDPKLFLKKHKQYGESAEDQEALDDLIKEVLKYKNISPEVLKIIAQDPNAWIRQKVASNPNTPPETLAILAEDEDESVRKATSENPNVTSKILTMLARDEEDYVREAVAKNPKTPLNILKKLAEDKDYSVRIEVASNPNTPEEVLKILANDQFGIVRKNVAYNPNTSLENLEILATDEDSHIRTAILENPNATPEILKLAIERYTVETREYMAGDNENPIILAILAIDSNGYVRRTLAKNPSLTTEILAKLARDEDEFVRINIARNKNVTPEILRMLGEDPDFYVRIEVASNLNTPKKTLALLAEDEYESVRKATAENPNTPQEIAQKLKAELGLKESRKPKKISLSSIIFRN